MAPRAMDVADLDALATAIRPALARGGPSMIELVI
jgi:hypothetical protein